MMHWGYEEYLSQPEWFVKELLDFFEEVSKKK